MAPRVHDVSPMPAYHRRTVDCRNCS